jgi:hypothetical protein
MEEENTTAAVRRYLDEWPTLAGASPTEPVVLDGSGFQFVAGNGAAPVL